MVAGQYVTNKRYLPLGNSRFIYYYDTLQHRINKVDLNQSGPGNWSAIQETTSFRTSSLSDAEVPQSDLLPNLISETKAVDRDYFPRQSGDNGHPFSTYRSYLYQTDRNVTLYAPDRFYQGSLTPQPLSGRWYGLKPHITLVGSSDLPPMTSSEITEFGQVLINKARPLIPSTSLTVALAEIVRDGIPDMPLRWLRHVSNAKGQANLSSAKKVGKHIGSEYLNAVFGFEPLARDLASLLVAIVKSKDIIDRTIASSGAIQHRERSLTPIVSEIVDYKVGYRDIKDAIVEGSYTTGLSNQWKETTVDMSVSQNLTKEYWFSGAFQYHLSSDSSLYGSIQRASEIANAVLGSRITPSTWWELMPFSWLVDWFVGIQRSLDLYSAFESDGLVMPYGYLMKKSTRTTIVSLGKLTHVSGFTKQLSSSFRIVRKERVRATPFGFGLNTSSFSAKQWAILAALGLTRSYHVLNVE